MITDPLRSSINPPTAIELAAIFATQDISHVCEQIARAASHMGDRGKRPQSQYSVHALQQAVRQLTSLRDSLWNSIEVQEVSAKNGGNMTDDELIAKLREEADRLGVAFREANDRAAHLESLWNAAVDLEPSLMTRLDPETFYGKKEGETDPEPADEIASQPPSPSVLYRSLEEEDGIAL